MIPNYNLLVKTPLGVSKSYIDDFESLEYARSTNNVGKATIVLPHGYSISDFGRDYRLEIWRQAVGGTSMYIEGRTFWLIRRIKRTMLPGGRWKTELLCHDSLDLLARRNVDYNRDTYYADKLIINGNDDYEDNLIKAFVRENLGSLSVIMDRNLSAYLTVAANTSSSATSTAEKQASYRSVLSTCQELAQLSTENGVPLYFDIDADRDGNMIFFTYVNQRGIDLTIGNSSTPVVFSDTLGNLSDISITRDYSNEITAVTVGGLGNGSGRATALVLDANRIAQSPFNRIEEFHDARDWEESTFLIREGEWRLQQGKPKINLSAKAIDLPQSRYGLHYHYGDKVSVVADNVSFSPVVDAVSVKVANGREELDIRLNGEIAL